MSNLAHRFQQMRSHLVNNKESIKATGLSLASGAGSYYLAKLATEKVSFLRDSWWATPAAMAILGHFVARKNAAVGSALMGAAGYAGAMAYDWKASADKQKASQTKGFDDAGAFSSQVFESAGIQAAGAFDSAGVQPMAAGYDDGANGFDDGVNGFDDASGDESFAIMG